MVKPYIVNMRVSFTESQDGRKVLEDALGRSFKSTAKDQSGTGATYTLSTTNISGLLISLGSALKKLGEGADATDPSNITQIWLTIQQLDEAIAPAIAVNLVDSYPEAVRAPFQLPPKKTPFRLWPFGRDR